MSKPKSPREQLDHEIATLEAYKADREDAERYEKGERERSMSRNHSAIAICAESLKAFERLREAFDSETKS